MVEGIVLWTSFIQAVVWIREGWAGSPKIRDVSNSLRLCLEYLQCRANNHGIGWSGNLL
jgi:hypothetical protein